MRIVSLAEYYGLVVVGEVVVARSVISVQFVCHLVWNDQVDLIGLFWMGFGEF